MHSSRRRSSFRRPLSGSRGRLELDRGQPVDARRVLRALVVAKSLRTARPELLRGPEIGVLAMSLEAHERDAVTARIRDPSRLHDHDRAPGLVVPRSLEPGVLEELFEPRIARRDDLAPAVDPHDARRSGERAEHDHDPPVLADVGDGLRAGADDVQVRDGSRPQHPQTADRPPWRDVDMAVAIEWSRTGEEERLSSHPGGEALVDLVEYLAHAARVAAGRRTEAPPGGALAA